MTSAFPPTVDDLLPEARQLAERLGELPSRNRLMRELHIGPDKANALLTALEADPGTSVPDPGTPVSPAGPAPDMEWPPTRPVIEASGQGSGVAYPGTTPTTTPPAPARPGKPVRSWPVILLALPAFVAVWSGWVGLGALTGFGIVHPLPGIFDGFRINTAITLPIGVEAYAAYAIRVALSPWVSGRARRFARWSTGLSLLVGAAGQVAYHLIVAHHITTAPMVVDIAVGSLPVAVLGMGATLAHLIATDQHKETKP